MKRKSLRRHVERYSTKDSIQRSGFHDWIIVVQRRRYLQLGDTALESARQTIDSAGLGDSIHSKNTRLQRPFGFSFLMKQEGGALLRRNYRRRGSSIIVCATWTSIVPSLVQTRINFKRADELLMLGNRGRLPIGIQT